MADDSELDDSQAGVFFQTPDDDAETIEDDEDTEDTSTVDDAVSEPGKSDRGRVGRPPKRQNRKQVDVSPAVVSAVLQWADRVNNADDKTLELAESLLGVKRADDDSRLISALMSSDSVADARKKISQALELASLDDLRYAVEVSKLDRSARRDLWELESGIDPDLASEITDGTGKLPTNDLYAEVSIIRRIQKESNIFRSTLDEVTELLG